MNFTTEFSMTEEIELTDSELKTATGGWRGGQGNWELVWTPNGPVWELVPAYWGGWDHDDHNGWWGNHGGWWGNHGDHDHGGWWGEHGSHEHGDHEHGIH
jgi:hypothetical protein